MKPIFKIILLAAAYLLTYVLGSCTGLIHPACYAYVGAILPLLTAFIYLLTCATIRGFGAATLLNGFVFVMLLIAGEADPTLAIGFAILTALAEIIRYFCKYDTLIPGWLAAHGIEEATYCPPKGYFVADENPEAFEAYDATFPYKEKLRLPGQLVF